MHVCCNVQVALHYRAIQFLCKSFRRFLVLLLSWWGTSVRYEVPQTYSVCYSVHLQQKFKPRCTKFDLVCPTPASSDNWSRVRSFRWYEGTILSLDTPLNMFLSAWSKPCGRLYPEQRINRGTCPDDVRDQPGSIFNVCGLLFCSMHALMSCLLAWAGVCSAAARFTWVTCRCMTATTAWLRCVVPITLEYDKSDYINATALYCKRLHTLTVKVPVEINCSWLFEPVCKVKVLFLCADSRESCCILWLCSSCLCLLVPLAPQSFHLSVSR